MGFREIEGVDCEIIMPHISYKDQPVTRIMVNRIIVDLVNQLSNTVEEKMREDPSFDEIVTLVNQIASNLVDAQEQNSNE